MGEVFRDMAEAGQHLAVQDTTIAKPHLAEHRKDKAPNIEEFCIVWKQGHKAVIKSKFKETLEICAVQNYETMDKIISILASPLQDQLRRWVKFTVGMDSFQIHGVHEMTLSQCTHFWQHWLDRVVSFYELIMANVPARHFDSQLQDALAGIQPRNDTNLNNLFWPVKGRDFQGDYPVKDAKRGDELLPWVTDKQYKEIYQRLKAKHSFDPMNKQESRNFIKHNIPANADTVGVNFIRMVVQIVFDYALEFSPKENPADDSYPTVDTTIPDTKNVTSTKVSDYMERSRIK